MNDGYWKKDDNGDYHWISYSGIGVMFIVIAVACLYSMTKVVAFCRVAESAIFNNLLIVVLVSILETVIVGLIIRHKFIVEYLFNCVHFTVFLLTFAFMAKWLGEINIESHSLDFIYEGIKYCLRCLASLLVFSASSVFAFGIGISAQVDDKAEGSPNFCTIIAVLIQAAGMGLFILLDYIF